MDTVLEIGLTVISFLGVVFLIIGTFLLSMMTVMLFKLNKFIKKQKPLFDVMGKFSTISLFKKRNNQ